MGHDPSQGHRRARIAGGVDRMRVSVEPDTEHRLELFAPDRLGEVVHVPASMHLRRSSFMALAVSATIGRSRNRSMLRIARIVL